MASVDEQIQSAAQAISSNIDSLSLDRGLLAQNILGQLRNLVEAVIVRIHTNQGDAEVPRMDVAVKAAIDAISGTAKYNFLIRFHKLLQISASHYTFEGDTSERLMLKYYEYLLRTRELVQHELGTVTLANLEAFPVDLDPSLREYHQKIAQQIDASMQSSTSVRRTGRRYYIQNVRPFFVDGRIYYEVTFSVPIDRISKFNRIIAFTSVDIKESYAAKLILVSDSIGVLGQQMPIIIIRGWEVSVRPCEFNNFAKLLNQTIQTDTSSLEYRNLMNFLTTTSSSLLDLMDISDVRYQHIKTTALRKTQKSPIFDVLDKARELVSANRPGRNILRYLLLQLNNRILKQQFSDDACRPLSNLNVSYGCIPFDTMPFCTSLLGHNPKFSDLAESLDLSGRTHELLARRVKNNIEIRGTLYTPLAELEDLGDVGQLISIHNSKLYRGHRPARDLVLDKGHVFVQQYEDETVAIIEKLQEFARSGVAGYLSAVVVWLKQPTVPRIDDPLKEAALKELFNQSQVAVIYGAAGTGKSTMVHHIANYFAEYSKLFLAQTNPAVDNLKRRVNAPNGTFSTIASQRRRRDTSDYDVLFIDECSIVSNADLLGVLEATSCKLIVLVGDTYQLESIQFGNWFSILKYFIPTNSVFELTTPFRTTDGALLELWSKVRNLDSDIAERIAHHGYSNVLDASLFTPQGEDEIILCLNYDGLYGINNINRFLQSSNPGKSVTRGAVTYKVGDPVLFNETDRFKPLIYNNLKGRIVDVASAPGKVTFDVKLARPVSEFDTGRFDDLTWIEDSIVRFDVFESGDGDDDDEPVNVAVPFQVAYAVSIHKAQGLEYDSVKVVITNANEEDVTHSIFYTAITRARKNLKIFWTPETQQAILSSLVRGDKGKDVSLLSARRNLTPAKS